MAAPFDLTGRTAIVTGANTGLGQAIAVALAQAGAGIVAVGRSSMAQTKALVAETGKPFHEITADLATLEPIVGIVEQADAAAKADGSRLDILVNNAGILMLAPLDEFALEDFDHMFAVNVRAVFVGTQAAARHMQAGGRIINIGSVVADRSGFPTSSVYSMTKGAIASMTRGLARDLGPRGITVNTIQPGPTATDMNGAPGTEEHLSPLMALGRMGEDSEIASLAAYLTSPEASFVTGSALTIDGGYLA